MRLHEGRRQMRVGVCCLLAVLFGTAGCSEEKSVESTEPLHVAQAALLSSGTSQSEKEMYERRGPILETDEPLLVETREAPTPFVMEIDWEEANAYERIDASLLSSEAASQLARLPLPVLLPGTEDFLEHAVAVTDENWYTVTSNYDHHGVVVQSSRIGFAYDGPNGREVEERLVENDFQVSRASMIASVTFPAFGLVYTIEVICEAPDADPRCTEDDYVLSLANAMRIAGGAP